MRLFISYAHVDKYYVGQIVDILRSGGHDPWFDHALLPGQDWKQTLLDAIRDCDAFVYALTPESVASEWCQWEFARAVELGKPVLPVLLQAKTDLPEALSRYQYADFSAGPTPQATAKLMGGLSQIMITIPREEAPPAPSDPGGVPAQAAQAEPTPARKPRRERPQPGSVSITQTVRDSSDVQTFGVVHGDIYIGERDAPQKEETPSPTPSGGHVYLAYSHDDLAYVTAFKTDLRARGLAAWSDEDIEFGQDREAAAAQALEGCAVFVVVMSESSAGSDAVKAEIEAAARLGKPIFPLWLSGEVFPGLARLRPADVRSGGMPPRAFYEALMKAILGGFLGL